MIAVLKSDKAMTRRLKEAARKSVTRNELVNQQISFVYGNLPEDSTITREQVAKKLRENEGD